MTFLQQLWGAIEYTSEWIESHLAQFTRSRFHVPACVEKAGKWEIAVEDLREFLLTLVAMCHLSVLPSAIDYVLAINDTFLTKKRDTRRRLQLQHIQTCVQKALLTAEEEQGNGVVDAMGILHSDAHDDARGIFQTELREKIDTTDVSDEVAVCLEYNDGPSATEIDRNAPGSVLNKSMAGAQVAMKQRMARSIVNLLHSRSNPSNWGNLRQKFLVQERHAGMIAIETDLPKTMDAKTGGIAGSASSKKKSVRENLVTGAAVSPKKASVVVVVATSSPIKNKNKSAEPDAATLANIFSLGTPRQLSPDELARRNDILALLEREAANSHRRMAVASVVTLSTVPVCVDEVGKPISTEHDRAFREYAAQVSSVTMTGETCVPPGGESMSPSSDKRDGRASTKKSKHSNDGRLTIAPTEKSKYDLTLEPPAYGISEGNAHTRIPPELALCSPIKKSKARGHIERPSNAVVALGHAGILPSPPVGQPRPIETASVHLPQLDTNRLAVGVKAVVRGVEKRGPRHSPSRNSRVRLHNYNVR